MPDETAFIALGSNLGNPVANILKAIQQLQNLSDEPLRTSTLWRSSPVDCPPGSPIFVNAVVALVRLPDETPESLLRQLQQIERDFGRKPKQVLNEPRPLDLDLISFGKQVRSTAELVLPHPRAHKRRFVLLPLSELAPDLILPGQIKPVLRLLEDLPEEGVTRLRAGDDE